MTIERKEVRLEDILLDEGNQARASEDEKAIAEYAEAMGDGTTFPAVVLFKGQGDKHTIGDGNHRVRAAKSIGRTTITAEVHASNDPHGDARFYSCGANKKHGVRQTNADKRRAVTLVVKDPDRKDMSSRDIAKHTGTSHTFVLKIIDQQGGNVSTLPVFTARIAASNDQTGQHPVGKEVAIGNPWAEGDEAERTFDMAVMGRDIGWDKINVTAGNEYYIAKCIELELAPVAMVLLLRCPSPELISMLTPELLSMLDS